MNLVSLTRDAKHRAIWVALPHSSRPCFTSELLDDILEAKARIGSTVRGHRAPDEAILFQVMTSQHPGVFSLGGDLSQFVDWIKFQARDLLVEYGQKCVELAFAGATNYGIPDFTTICLVQGQAYGGGFECALSHNVLIAEEQARFMFPELRYGMFPGMGAVSLLTRRVGRLLARDIIESDRVWSAEELLDAGVVDVVCGQGNGRAAVEDYMEQSTPGSRALTSAYAAVGALTERELSDIVAMWADAALQVTPKTLSLMERIARAQSISE